MDKVHQAIEFDQSPWLALYINFKTQLRMKVKNDFEKDFFNLMNNSVFGKTMENIKKHRNIKLVTNQEGYLKRVMKPNFKSGIQFSKNLMGCRMGKISVAMNKPDYLRLAILDLSKIIMYEFHYHYMLLKYGNNIQLCYMDTDSLVYNVTKNNFYEDIAGDFEARFNMSGYSYSLSHPLPMGVNKNIIRLMKDKIGHDRVHGTQTEAVYL